MGSSCIAEGVGRLVLLLLLGGCASPSVPSFREEEGLARPQRVAPLSVGAFGTAVTSLESMLVAQSAPLRWLWERGLPIQNAEFLFPSNCWNTTFFALGLTHTFYQSGFKETYGALASPLCRMLGLQEPLEAMDVVAFRVVMPYDPDPITGRFRKYVVDERHTAIYLDSESVYSKNGLQDHARIQSLEGVTALYVEPQDRRTPCLRVADYGEALKQTCFAVVSYHRCQGVVDYLASPSAQALSVEVRALLERGFALDRQELEAQWRSDDGARRQVDLRRKEVLEKVQQALQSRGNDATATDDETLLLQWLEAKVDRILAQRE